ncbi:MAG: hypothetical protein HY904_12700 [Deltaproteobacteria bacterium]|nr:hypothetical protein [Deltaproteobacteria bacterium]
MASRKRAFGLAVVAGALVMALWTWRAADAGPVRTRGSAAPAAATQPRTATPRAPEPEPAPAAPVPQPPRTESLVPVPARPEQPGDGGTTATVAAWLRSNAEEARRAVDILCQEHESLRFERVFPPHKTEQDAAEFMALQVDWMATEHHPEPVLGAAHLATGLRDRVRDLGPDWLLKLTDDDLRGLDFSWLQRLREFDHWTPRLVGPPSNWPREDSPFLPLADYLQLQTWGKLRFAAALRTGDLLAASADVQHLAQLLHSQGILVADMVALALMNMDARMRDTAEQMGSSVTGWEPRPVDAELRDRFKRMSAASLGFMLPGVPEDVMRRALACSPTRCVTLIEGTAQFSHFEHFWPEPVGRTSPDALVAAAGCDGGLLRRARSVPPADLEAALAFLREGPSAGVASLFVDFGAR